MKTLEDQSYPDKIGVVTVLFNSYSVLPGFFKSLAESENVDIDLIVVSNDQDAQSVELTRRLGAESGIPTTVIENAENIGVAEANNQGLRLCMERQHPYVLISNNDIEFGPQVISGVRDALKKEYDAIAPLITYFDNPGLVWYGGGAINEVLARTEHHGHLQNIKETDRKLRPTGYAPTCFLMIRRCVLDQIGLMDPVYFVYYDDSDFILRMRRAGFRLGYSPRHLVLHKVSNSTGGSESEFTIYYTNRNRILFIRKNIAFPLRLIPLFYLLMTKILRLPFIGKNKRNIVLKALCDGFRISV
jgi:GT2 family glycosyltransferase